MENITLAAIGDMGSVVAFRAIGVKTVFATTKEDIEKSIDSLAEAGCKVIFITEQAAKSAYDLIEMYRSKTYPIILPIPSREGSEGMGLKGINANVEKAIGTNIFSE